MRSSKSRSRSKSNRNRPTGGNILNRVFDSSGPEGKVRGTPQQIIDKYNQLARDAQLSNDRVATENFQQHAEHYMRMSAEAQREQAERQAQQQQQQQNQQNRANQGQGGQNGGDQNNNNQNRGDQGNGGQNGGDQNRNDQGRGDRNRGDQAKMDQPGGGEQPQPAEPKRARARPAKKLVADAAVPASDVIDLSDQPDGSGLVETPESQPRPRRTRRKAEPNPEAAAETKAAAPEVDAPAPDGDASSQDAAE